MSNRFGTVACSNDKVGFLLVLGARFCETWIVVVGDELPCKLLAARKYFAYWEHIVSSCFFTVFIRH